MRVQRVTGKPGEEAEGETPACDDGEYHFAEQPEPSLVLPEHAQVLEQKRELDENCRHNVGRVGQKIKEQNDEQ